MNFLNRSSHPVLFIRCFFLALVCTCCIPVYSGAEHLILPSPDPSDPLSGNETYVFPLLIDKPGIYILNSSYMINGSAIHITHSDVILEGLGTILNGSAIPGSGIILNNPEHPIVNITIRNITIKNFETGLFIKNASAINLDTISLTQNLRAGLSIESSENILITGSSAQNTRNDITGGNGILISGSRNITIMQSQISGNGKSGKTNAGGVMISGSPDITIVRSTISSNPGYGIKTEAGADNFFISDCEISANSGDGVSIGASSSPEIQNCILNKNKEAGIELLKTKTPKIIGNQINSCLMGLSVSDSEGMQLSGNSLKNNKIGFDISASDIRFYDHQISYTNTIDSRILLYLNGAHVRIIVPGTNPAMVILVNASDIQLSDLVLSKNSAGVILVNSTNITLSDLTFMENGIGLRSEFGTKNLTCTRLHAERNLVSGYYLANTEHFLLSSLYGQESPAGIYLRNATDGVCSHIVMTDISGLKTRMPSGITLSGCNNITITKSQFSQCSYAGLVSDTHHLNLSENVFSSNTFAGSVIISGPVQIVENSFVKNDDTGLVLKADNSTILKNTLIDNQKFGLLLVQGNNNLFAENTFKNYNNCLIQDKNSINTWNLTSSGNANLSYLSGNYWGDPAGEGFSDLCTSDPQGFCQEPYILQRNNIDYHPLSAQQTMKTSTINTDLNQNGREDLQDVVVYMNKVSSGDTTSLYDYSGDGRINLQDVVSLFHIIIKK